MSLQEELRQVEEDLERLRAEVAELRRQVGEIGPTDSTERAMLINLADEEEILVRDLEARREDLLKRLDEDEREHAEPRETT
jgi:cell division septum initiation protein DivIVA